MTKWILALGITTVAALTALALLGILNYVVAGLLVTATIGVVGWVLNYTSKPREKAAFTNKEKTPEKEPKSKKEIVNKEIVLDADDYETFTVNLENKDRLVGEISSEDPINVFLVNRYALSKFENEEEFSFEDCGSGEGIRRTRIDFAPTKAGRWFLVVENEDDKKTIIKVDLYVEKQG
jgi:hypothetical protein